MASAFAVLNGLPADEQTIYYWADFAVPDDPQCWYFVAVGVTATAARFARNGNRGSSGTLEALAAEIQKAQEHGYALRNEFPPWIARLRAHYRSQPGRPLNGAELRRLRSLMGVPLPVAVHKA